MPLLKRTLMQRQVMISVLTSRLSQRARPRMPLMRRRRSQKLRVKKPKKRVTKRKVRPRTKRKKLKKMIVLKSMLVRASRSS